MSHYVVKFEATKNTNEFLWFGCTGMEAARYSADGCEVRRAEYLQQPWSDMAKPKKLIDYGNDMFLLSW